MSMVTVKVNGVDKVMGNLVVANQKAMRVVNDAIQQAATTTYTLSKEFVTVDTGALYDSGTVDFPDPLKAVITYGTDHCWYVELGTSKMRAHPFLYPAFQYGVDKFQVAVRKLYLGV